jgi:hypothetical protein
MDDTIKELASRVQADVIVIDAAQLAAGEHGSFGKGEPLVIFLFHLLTRLSSRLRPPISPQPSPLCSFLSLILPQRFRRPRYGRRRHG